MSGRPERGTPYNRDDPQAHADADADADAADAATAIAGLRRRLARQGTLQHPAVRRELSQLEQQLTAQLDWSARQPGRHRFPADRAEPRHGEDTDQPGLNLVTAVITGCRGGQDDLNASASAWQRVTAASTTGHPAPPGPQPAPAPALQLLPGT